MQRGFDVPPPQLHPPVSPKHAGYGSAKHARQTNNYPAAICMDPSKQNRWWQHVRRGRNCKPNLEGLGRVRKRELLLAGSFSVGTGISRLQPSRVCSCCKRALELDVG